MKTRYTKPSAQNTRLSPCAAWLAATSIPVKGDGEGGEEITDPSEQLSKKHPFNVWEKDTEDE